MKAVWYDRQGPANEVLQYSEQPTPEAGAGEVRIKLEASGVNPADCARRGGAGFPQDFPLIITNSDGAGIVDQVGKGVPERWLGKRVWLYNGQRFRPFGTAAETIALNVDLVTELPDGIDMAAGATLGIPCMTAHRAVFLAAPVQGITILVTGGAGAVANYAIQLAKWAGANVIATVSSLQKAKIAKEAGADHVIDYKKEDVAARVMEFTGGVDHIVEVDFGGNLATSLKVLKMNGSLAFYASRGNPSPTVAAGGLVRLNATVHAMSLPTSPLASRQRAQRDITSWLKSGRARLHVAAKFPLRDTVAAHQAVEKGDKLGTVVVEPHR